MSDTGHYVVVIIIFESIIIITATIDITVIVIRIINIMIIMRHDHDHRHHHHHHSGSILICTIFVGTNKDGPKQYLWDCQLSRTCMSPWSEVTMVTVLSQTPAALTVSTYAPT